VWPNGTVITPTHIQVGMYEFASNGILR